MKKIVIIFVLLLLIKSNLLSQSSSLDSLKILIKLANTDTARISLTIRYAKELTYNNPKECIRLLGLCIDDARKSRFIKGEADALFALGVPYTLDANYETSLKLWFDANILYQQLGNKIGQANCLKNQGNIYYFMNEFLKAQKYYENALTIYKETNNYVGIASCISNLGLVYQMSNNFEKALEYQTEGLIIEEKAGNKRGMAISHISISSVLLDLKQYVAAKKHAFIAINISKAIADSTLISDGMLRLADCYRLLREYDLARFYLRTIIQDCEKNKNLRLLAYTLDIQTQLYDSLGLYQKAFDSQKQLMAVKDTLLNKEKTAQLIEMQTKFETERKENENEILLARNFNQKLVLWGMLIIVFLAFVLTFQISISRKKLKISHDKLLILNQETNQQKEEIETQAENLISANEAISAQRDQLENTNQKTSDSIVYASFIQRAMLPSEELFQAFSSEHFILFKPRDIVSGDFYWLKEKDDCFLIAVADCTGHGVPGALLSMMGISFLNDIVANTALLQTSLILEKLRYNVKHALGQFSNKNLRKEGMEIGLIKYNPKKKSISFSGAYLSFWLSRNGILKEYKSDRMSIGISLKESPFTQVDLDLQDGDTIYMFTDGYADQLGGQSRKKFLRRNLIHEFSIIAQHPLCEQKDYLEYLHQSWKGDKFEQIDDILVLGIKF